MLETEAILDMQQAFVWYEEQKKDLGYFFLDELEDCFQKICNAPLNYSSVTPHFRKIKLNKFPYLIIYEIESDNVIINSVRHTGRKPRY